VSARPVVLVTDGDRRTALAVVRSLGLAGYPVRVAAPSRRSIAAVSRHARWSDVVADPAQSPGAFVDDVVRLVREHDVRFVIPVTDAALLALTRERDRLGHASLPWPGADAVRSVADKAQVAAAAGALGIAVPRQRVATTIDEALAAASELRFPLVLKPSRSVREQAVGPFTRFTVTHAAEASVVTECLAALGPAAFPILLQERVVGPGVGVSALLWEGRLLAHFSHRRLREHPPSGGVSVYAESIAPDADLIDRSVALLGHFGWRGVAMVEYKVDAATGTPYLMEVNGRFWGSLQLAVDAGVDFPARLLAAAQGEAETETPPAYRTGVRFRWWWGDVDHLLLRLALSPARLSLPPGAASRIRVLRDFLASGPPARASDVIRRDDPRPFAAETVEWLRSRLARGARWPARLARRTVSAGRAAAAATSLSR
jgi:predicted ATP-grasp superfamily ATP-dependent carboligase